LTGYDRCPPSLPPKAMPRRVYERRIEFALLSDRSQKK
jgi:hypothetical protein